MREYTIRLFIQYDNKLGFKNINAYEALLYGMLGNKTNN